MSNIERVRPLSDDIRNRLLGGLGYLIGPDRIEQAQMIISQKSTALKATFTAAIGTLIGSDLRQLFNIEAPSKQSWEIVNGNLKLFGQKGQQAWTGISYDTLSILKAREEKKIAEINETPLEKRAVHEGEPRNLVFDGISIGASVALSLYNTESLTREHFQRCITRDNDMYSGRVIIIPEYWNDGCSLRITDWSVDRYHIQPIIR